jgi:hypothetical protein
VLRDVVIWSTEDLGELRRLRVGDDEGCAASPMGIDGGVVAVRFVPRTTQLVALYRRFDRACFLHRWDASTGAGLAHVRLSVDAFDLAVSPDGGVALATSTGVQLVELS